MLIPLQRPSAVIAMDDALISLEKEDPLMARLIELRYFGGLTAEESSVVVKLEVLLKCGARLAPSASLAAPRIGTRAVE